MADTRSTEKAAGSQLHRSLGALFGVAVGVGSMIGVGVLRTPGIILEHVGAPGWALLIWGLGAIYVLLCVNYMAELASTIPRSGGAYAFAERSLGRFGGVVVGWSDFLNAVFAIALLAVALSEYIAELAPLFSGRTGLLAALLIGVFATLNMLGIRTASGTQQFTSLAKLIALWSLIAGCFLLAPPSHDSARAFNPVTAAGFSVVGAIASFQLVLGAFNGWAAPAYFSGEARDSRHGVARALLSAALLVSATYVLINAAVLYAVPAEQLVGSKLAAADALERLTSLHGMGSGVGVTLFTALAVISLPSTLQAVMMQTSRTLYAMSQDGLFARWGAYVSPRGSPVNAILATSAIAIVLSVTSTFETLFTTFTVFAVLNNLILLCGVVRLRRTEPHLERPHRTIGYPWSLLPIVLVDIVIFFGFALANVWQCLLSAVMAVALYIAYRRHWRENQPAIP